MTLLHHTVVTLDDAVGFLSARTFSPSTMGLQLEAARENAPPAQRPAGSKKSRKAKVASRKGICGVCREPIEIGHIVVASRGAMVHLRCCGERDVHEGMHVKSPTPDGYKARDAAEDRIPRDAAVIRCLDALAGQQNANGLKDRPSLARLHRAMVAKGSERTQGELVVQCLRAYEERKLRSQEHALAAVYLWAQSRLPETFSPVEHDDDTLAQAFRTNKVAKARRKAADLYADCYLVLAAWIVSWNRKQIQVA